MTIKHINTLFDQMDEWRHYPNYQLERRADIFFSLYLPEVLEKKLGFPVRPELIPEFPVRIGTIYPDNPIDKSYKIDYVAIAAKNDEAVLVELKTEGRSLRPEQDEYLKKAQEVGMVSLLEGLLKIFRATNSKRKYFCLIEHLESIGLLRIPMRLKDMMAKPALQGVNEASYQIEITANIKKPLILYVQPNGDKSNVIPFREFAEVVQKHHDPISQRFATSLIEWADIQAGEKRVRQP